MTYLKVNAGDGKNHPCKQPFVRNEPVQTSYVLIGVLLLVDKSVKGRP